MESWTDLYLGQDGRDLGAQINGPAIVECCVVEKNKLRNGFNMLSQLGG
jgi:hypothetical protein